MKKTLIVVGTCFCLSFVACTPKPTAQSYIDKGLVLLSENNYEEAIIAFTNAIEIDEKNEKAYLGRARAYYSTKQFNQAFADYQLAILNDNNNEEVYNEVFSLLKGEGDVDNAYKIIKQKEESIGVDSLSEDEHQFLKSHESINQIYEACFDNDWNTVQEIINTKTFSDFVSLFSGSGKLYERNNNNGNSIALFRVNEEIMIYCGNMVNGLRDGKGYWLDLSGDKLRICFCDWKNDFPNGYFEIIGVQDGHIGTSGQMVNGLYDGVVEYDIPNFGFFHVTYNNGISKVVEVLDTEPPRYVFARNERGNRNAMIAGLENDLVIKNGIWGFGEQKLS